MKYEVGDRVRIKSLDWYNKNKNEYENVPMGQFSFNFCNTHLCGAILTIKKVLHGYYLVEENSAYWTDEMIEGLAEEETKFEPKFKVGDKVILDPYPCVVTDVNWRDSLHGFVYIVRGGDFGKMVREEDLVLDERTVPNTNEIIQLIKNDWNNFKDRYDIPDDYHFVDKNGNEINISEIVLEKKKKEYPKTYEECSKIAPITWGGVNFKHYNELLSSFYKLLICRDAYWKIAGEEMGLDKSWKPISAKGYCTHAIIHHTGHIRKSRPWADSALLEFPTEEMRDAFYENFQELIESVKELL